MSADKLIDKNIKELMDTMVTKMEVVNPKNFRSYSNDSLNSLDNVSLSEFLPNSDDASLIVRLPPSPNSVKEKRRKEEEEEKKRKNKQAKSPKSVF